MTAQLVVGERYGLLEITDFIPGSRATPRKAICLCECGNVTTVTTTELRCGHVKSCGCLQRKRTSEANRKHGLSGSKEYNAWIKIRERCHNPNNKSYRYYGGRGITVCERWLKFENFYADMGPSPSALHTVERENNNLGYSPDNCSWATRKVQSNNSRRCHFVVYEGERLNITQLAERTEIPRRTLSRLINRGLSVEVIIQTKAKGSTGISSKELKTKGDH